MAETRVVSVGTSRPRCAAVRVAAASLRPELKSSGQALHRARVAVWLPQSFQTALAGVCQLQQADPCQALAALFAAFIQRCAAADEVQLGWLDLRDQQPLRDVVPMAVPLHWPPLEQSSWHDRIATWLEPAAPGRHHADAPWTVLVTTQPESAAAAAQRRNLCAALDAVLHISAGAGPLRLALVCDTRIAGLDALRRLRRNWLTLLHAALAEPHAALCSLALVSRSEQRCMARWNDTAVALPAAFAGATLKDLIERQVDRSPNAVAVVLDRWTIGGTLSFLQLDQQANHLAHTLQALGVGPNVIVGVFLERSVNMVVAMLAIWKAGGAYMPLEPDFPAQRLCESLIDSAAAWVISTATLRPRLPSATPVHCLDDNPARLQGPLSAQRPHSKAGPQDSCYVIYTSGSTGKPKGAVLPHRAICHHMAWMIQHHALGPEDHVLQKTPFSFDASVWEFLAPLLTGARIVLARPGGHRDMPYLARTIIENQVTTLQLVPSVLQLLVDEPSFAACSSLRRVFCGGEALSSVLVRRFFAKRPIALHNLYGPTECCIDTTTFDCRADVDTPYQPIGKPIWNTRHHVLDHALQRVPIGTPGELFIGGAGLALGYLNRAQLTAEKFIRNPFDPAGQQTRLYRTGDRVRLCADGVFEFLGRIDFQVKLNGFRIELGEIEALLEAHPQVRQAVAMLREDRPGHKVLAAYVTTAKAAASPSPDSNLSPQALRQHLAQHLPSYMLPSVCVVLDSLPLTPHGKIDRSALPAPRRLQLAQEGSPARTSSALVAPTVAALQGIWAQVLGGAQPGLHDKYFDMGGDSLGLMQMGLAIRIQLGVAVSTEQLFETTTLLAQALLVDALRQGRRPTPTAMPFAEPACLPAQARTGLASIEQKVFWASAQMLRNWPLFNTSEVLHFASALNRPALQRAVNAVVARHASLRTVLQLREQVLWQNVQSAAPVVMEEVACTSATPQELQARLALAVQVPINLQCGPVSRWLLLTAPHSQHWLVLIVHHAQTDGHSTQLVMGELLALYAAHSTGQPVAAPDPAPRYLDYAHWQQQRLQAGEFDGHRQHWQQVLAGSPPRLKLPSSRPRRAVPRWFGGRQTRQLSRALQQALKALAARHKATLYMALLAAFDALLCELTGQTDVLVGTSVAQRNAPGLARVAGCFISALPLRVQIDRQASWLALLERVRHVCIDAFAHQDLPLGMACETLAGAPLPVWLELHDQQHGWDHRFAALGVHRLDLDRGISESELSFEVDDTAAGLVCHAQYKTELFDGCQVQVWLARFEQLLQALVAQPESLVFGPCSSPPHAPLA